MHQQDWWKKVLYKVQLKQVILNLMQFKEVPIKVNNTGKMKTQSLSYPPDAPAVPIIPQTILSLLLDSRHHASA